MAVARLYLPETNTSRQLVLAIANSLKVMDRFGSVSSISQRDEKWSRICSKRLNERMSLFRTLAAMKIAE